MQYIKPKIHPSEIPDGWYEVESIYANKKPTSKQKVEVKNGRVYAENFKYSLTVDAFFHDHEIVTSKAA